MDTIIVKSQLDDPICDLIEEATNKETPREFIRNSEEEFCIAPADIDNMSVREINDYIDHLDDLWNK